MDPYLHIVPFSELQSALKIQREYSLSFFLKNGPFPASFSLFLSFQYTVDSKQMFNKYINFRR